MSVLIIKREFETVIGNWAANRNPNINVGYEALPADHKLPFVSMFMFPVNANAVFLNGAAATEYTGYVQFNITGEKWRGTDEVYSISDEIKNLFPCDSILNSNGEKVYVSDPPLVNRVIIEENAITLPMFVYYRAFIFN